ENRNCIDRCPRETAEIAASGHRADENAFVETERLHAYPVTKDRAARKGTRRIDCDNADTFAALAINHRQLINERRLTRAGRTRDSDHERAARALVNLFHQ